MLALLVQRSTYALRRMHSDNAETSVKYLHVEKVALGNVMGLTGKGMLVNNVKSRFLEQQQLLKFPGYVRPWQATTSKQRKKCSQLRARSDRNLS